MSGATVVGQMGERHESRAATTALLVGTAVASAAAGAWLVASSADRRRASADTSVAEAATAASHVRSIARALCDLFGACPPPHAPSTRGVHFPPPPPMPDVLASIGNTPMIRVNSLSDATGCDVMIKCEFANPGGSVKDRVALRILTEALESGELIRGGTVTEGTAGSTGVSLAMVARALGCNAHLILPDDAATEKPRLMESYGATCERVRPVSITHQDHFVNVARRRAGEMCELDGDGLGYFANQFENTANYRAHLEGTGPEIWRQCGEATSNSVSTSGRRLDAFVCACGTGGTLSGIASYLKRKDPLIECHLVDPQGSSLYNKVTRGVLYNAVEAEGKRLKNPFDTITEGVGINRLTCNFHIAIGGDGTEEGKGGGNEGPSLLSGAFRCDDREAVEMSRYLARRDGLFLGSSSCVNIVGAAKLARRLGPGHRVVTIACDSGVRHLSKFWSAEYVEKHGLKPEKYVRDDPFDFLDE